MSSNDSNLRVLSRQNSTGATVELAAFAITAMTRDGNYHPCTSAPG